MHFFPFPEKGALKTQQQKSIHPKKKPPFFPTVGKTPAEVKLSVKVDGQPPFSGAVLLGRASLRPLQQDIPLLCGG